MWTIQIQSYRVQTLAMHPSQLQVVDVHLMVLSCGPCHRTKEKSFALSAGITSRDQRCVLGASVPEES